MFRRKQDNDRYHPVPGQLLLAVLTYGGIALGVLGLYALVNWGTRSLMGY